MEKSDNKEEQQTAEDFEKTLQTHCPEFIELLSIGSAEERSDHLNII